MKNLLLLCMLFASISVFSQTSALVQANTTTISGSSSVGAIVDVTNTSSSNGIGIRGTATLGAGVYGQSTATSPISTTYGVFGYNASQGSTGYGVYGTHAGTGSAVYGSSNFGTGVRGTTSAGVGIYGVANSSLGIGGYFSSLNYALITGAGNVGIGTTPNLNLEEIIDINGRMRVRHSASTAGIWCNNSDNTISSNDGAFFGMYQASPGIEVAGIFIGNSWKFLIDRAGFTTFSNGAFFNGGGTFTGLVCASNISCVSDIRYKKNIIPLENSIANLLKINGVRYDWRQEEFPDRNFSDKNQIGFIAQEIEKIYPEMVFTDEKGYKSVDYARFTPVLVEAIKEQQKQIEALKMKINEIDKLKSEMASLKNMLLQTAQGK